MGMSQEKESKVDGGFFGKLTERNLAQLIELSRENQRLDRGKDNCVHAIPGVVDLSLVFSMLLLTDSVQRPAAVSSTKREDSAGTSQAYSASLPLSIDTKEKSKTDYRT